jgi:hypothetical protein
LHAKRVPGRPGPSNDDGDLRLHPIVAKLVDAETLEKMGAQKGVAAKGENK